MENQKIIGEPAYAKASADNTAHRSFNAGGASWLTTLNDTRLEASSVVYFYINFAISNFLISGVYVSQFRSFVISNSFFSFPLK